MLTGVTPSPSQMADMRSSSVSKHTQQLLLKFKINPRGVRLFVGQMLPRLRASRTEEKNGKLGSINGAQLVGDRSGSDSADCAAANDNTKKVIRSNASRLIENQQFQSLGELDKFGNYCREVVQPRKEPFNSPITLKRRKEPAS